MTDIDTKTDTAHVDGTHPVVLADGGDVVLVPHTRTGTWWHATRSARTARTGARYELELLRTRTPDDRGTEVLTTTGGVLTTRLELIASAATPAQVTRWSERLTAAGARPGPDGRFTLLPLPLRDGRMTVRGPVGALADPDGAAGVPIGSAASAGVLVPLTAAGADLVAASLAEGSGPPLEVDVAFRFDLQVPPCRFRVEADSAAVLAVLADHPVAVAGYFGPAGGTDEVAELTAELLDQHVVTVGWQSRPAGFTAERLAAMEEAVVQRWIGTAAERLGARVVPGADPVKVVLTDVPDDVDLTVVHDGARFLPDVVHRSADLPRLHGLTAGYLLDVATDDFSVPIVVDFAPDDRVQRYLCHVGYRTADGPMIVTSHDGTGRDGLVIHERMQWPPGQARPAAVELRYSISWTDLDWEAVEETVLLATDGPCVSWTVTPGARISEVSIVSDLTTADVGALGLVSWQADLPPVGGREPKDYSGGFVAEGAGPAGALERRTVAFPQAWGSAAGTVFNWSAELALPTGAVVTGSATFSLADSTEAVIAVADLQRD